MSVKLSNGYILPEGKLTPNALFVGGIDMKVKSDGFRRHLHNLLESLPLRTICTDKTDYVFLMASLDNFRYIHCMLMYENE